MSAKTIIRVTIITLAGNILLSVLKLVLGLAFKNVAVLSDAVHSISDVGTSLLVIFAVLVSSPKPDKKHNYGHEKAEALITLLFSLILAGVGGVLVWQGIQGIISPEPAEMNVFLISITVLSVIAKEAMFWYTIHHARKAKSGLLKADAWHHRSDSLSSIAVLAGLVASIFIETNLVESIAVILVAILIIKVAVDILKPALDQLLDRAAADEITAKIGEIIIATDGIKGLDSLNTRLFGNKIYADIEIAVDGSLSVEQSHDIAERLRITLEANEQLGIKHCMIHINPFHKQ